MDTRRMTEQDTPCPRGTKTKPCKVIQWIAQTGRYSCYGCGRIYSAHDVQVIRRDLGRKKKKVKEDPEEQMPLLGEA